MRINYTYQNFPNCPRATKYSRNAEASAAYRGILISLITIGAVIAFSVCTFSFFGNYNWGEFLGAVAFVIVAAIIFYHHCFIRPNNTQCEINVILAEEGNLNLSSEEVQQFCSILRDENRRKNKEAFTRFFLVFIVILFYAVALIAAIKGVYLLCNTGKGLFLLLGGIAVIGIFSYLIWKLMKGSSSKPTTNTASVSKGQAAKISNSVESRNITYCRKCGTIVLSNNVFCTKCGTKVK